MRGLAVAAAPSSTKTTRDPARTAPDAATGDAGAGSSACSRRTIAHETPDCHQPDEIPLLVRPVEHQHGARPVRPDGPPGDGIRPQAAGLQEAGLRRRAVPRRRHRPGRPRLAKHSEGSRRRQEDARRRGAVRRVHRPAALGRPADDRRGFTANSPSDRQYALDRAKRCVDIAREVGCKNYVLWLAREGTYIREAKDARTAVGRIVDAWNAILEHDPEIRVLGETKPNEPMDQAYLPTVGHMMAVGYKTIDPARSAS